VINILYLQHDECDEPYYILDWIKEKEYPVKDVKMWTLNEADSFPCFDSFDFLVVLGGEQGANDDDKYSWLKREKAFIKEALEKGKFVLGLCLGSQLVATTLGGQCTTLESSEIGWTDLEILETSNLLDSFRNVKVFNWHNDTWSLPDNAHLLAKSHSCVHQGFSFDFDRVIGLQFHPEMTLEGAKKMIFANPNSLADKNFDIQSKLNENLFLLQNEAFRALLDSFEQQILFKKLESD
jgi:GMP synthase-like glutamine amidotransferase